MDATTPAVVAPNTRARMPSGTRPYIAVDIIGFSAPAASPAPATIGSSTGTGAPSAIARYGGVPASPKQRRAGDESDARDEPAARVLGRFDTGCLGPTWHEQRHEERRQREPRSIDHEGGHRTGEGDERTCDARTDHRRRALHRGLHARGAGEGHAGELGEIGHEHGLRRVTGCVEESAEEDEGEEYAEMQADG